MSFGVCFRDNGGFMTIDFWNKNDKLKNLKFFSSPGRWNNHWKFKYYSNNGFYSTNLTGIKVGSLIIKDLST